MLCDPSGRSFLDLVLLQEHSREHRGPTSIFSLLSELRRTLAYELAADIVVHDRWHRSAVNRVDAPSRYFMPKGFVEKQYTKKKTNNTEQASNGLGSESWCDSQTTDGGTGTPSHLGGPCQIGICGRRWSC